MAMHALRSLVVFAPLLLVACGDKGSTGGGSSSATPSGSSSAKGASDRIASCNRIKQDSMCNEWPEKNISAGGEDHVKKMCEGLGDFKMEACPKDKRVGTCITPEGSKVFYSDGPVTFDAAKGEKSCKEGVPSGEWKAQ